MNGDVDTLSAMWNLWRSENEYNNNRSQLKALSVCPKVTLAEIC